MCRVLYRRYEVWLRFIKLTFEQQSRILLKRKILKNISAGWEEVKPNSYGERFLSYIQSSGEGKILNSTVTFIYLRLR